MIVYCFISTQLTMQDLSPSIAGEVMLNESIDKNTFTYLIKEKNKKIPPQQACYGGIYPD